MFNAIGKLIKDLEDLPLWASLLCILLVFGLIFGLICFETWVCFVLWNGCLVAVCPLLMEVGYWQMMGIWLLIRFLLPKDNSSSTND